MFTELYQHLMSRIESVKDSKGEAVIRWIDLQSGQLKGDSLPPVSMPCALIAFDEVGDFTHHSTNPVSKGAAFVEIELAFKINERTHSKNVAARDIGLSHFATMERIVAAIHGTDGEAFDTLYLESIKPESNRQDFRIFTLRFTLNAYITTSKVEMVDLKSLKKMPDFCVHPALK